MRTRSPGTNWPHDTLKKSTQVAECQKGSISRRFGWTRRRSKHLASRRFQQTRLQQKTKQDPALERRGLRWNVDNIGGKHSEELLNVANTSAVEETGSEGLEERLEM